MLLHALLGVGGHKRSVKHALCVGTSRVDAERLAELGDRPRFMDVAVEAERWLVAFNHRPDRVRADVVHLDLSAADDGLEVGVELVHESSPVP